jgi:hypothetical protein
MDKAAVAIKAAARTRVAARALVDGVG